MKRKRSKKRKKISKFWTAGFIVLLAIFLLALISGILLYSWKVVWREMHWYVIGATFTGLLLFMGTAIYKRL